MLLLVLSVVLSTGCMTVEGARAGQRRIASRRLAFCLGLNQRYPTTQVGDVRALKAMCLQESAEVCRSMGLEAGCGVDNLWAASYH